MCLSRKELPENYGILPARIRSRVRLPAKSPVVLLVGPAVMAGFCSLMNIHTMYSCILA